MKPVEPFLKLTPVVLDYEVPPPPKSWIERLFDLIEPAVDYVGGWGSALLIVTVACIGFGVSLPGPIGGTLVLIGAALTRGLLRYWSRSTRW